MHILNTVLFSFYLQGEFVRMNGEGLMLESSTLKLFMVA